MESIFQIVYVSQAHDDISYTGIHRILESSQHHNQHNELTGLLLFKDNHFIQILEGEQARVMETMGRLIQDRRHHHLKVLCEAHNSKRTFDRWPLAFHDGDIDQTTSHLVEDIFLTALGRNGKDKEVLLQMFHCFRRSSPHFQEA